MNKKYKNIKPLSPLGQLAVDAYFGQVEKNIDGKIHKFSKDEGEQKLNEAIKEQVFGGESNFNFYTWQQNKWDVFALVAETINVIMPATLSDELDFLVETRNTNWGDQLVFQITDTKLFDVSTIANGMNDSDAQKLDKGKLILYPKVRSIAVEEDLYTVISGRMNWSDYVDRVTRSFINDIRTRVMNSIYGAYSSLAAPYQVNMTGTFDVNGFVTTAQHVQAATAGLTPVVYGTKLALSKVIGSNLVSYNMMDELNNKGYLANFRGVQLVELKQAHLPNTDTFALDDTKLIVVPQGVERIAKVGFEGAPIVTETNSMNTADLSMEFNFQQKYDIAILSAGKFAIVNMAF